MSEDMQSQKPVNPLLERIRLPGETFTLPSGGLFYDDTIIDPSVKGAEIHVHPMVAIDEIMMKTPDMLFSGKAVEDVFKRCIPSILQPSKLLAKDVDFLLTALRKISYGEEMQVDYVHNCKDAKKHTYTINITNFLRSAKRIDPTSITKDFVIELDNGQVVKIQPIRFGEFVKVMQSLDSTNEDMTPEKAEELLIDSVMDIVVSVDDITDREMIREWLKAAPPKYLSAINKALEQTSHWGPEFNVEVVCRDCGERISFQAPMNPLAFFT